MFELNLNTISAPIAGELDLFSGRYKEAIRSRIGLLDIITRYLLKQKGKKIRPLLVLLSAKACGTIQDRSYRGALLVELLHSATLVHDDVVDSADIRRGLPSINAVWKNKVAVLLGDYLLSRGLILAVEGKDYDFLEVITKTVKRMSEGELLQIQKTRKLDIDEATYFKVISDKTASLISTCCEIGALSSSADAEVHLAMRNFGENLGLAFQIRDDILDIEGSSKIFGKPIGGDIKEKKITLPLLHALNSSGKSEASDIRKAIKSGLKKKELSDIIAFIEKYNGLQYAKEKAVSLANAAKDNLKILPKSESLTSLENLVDFSISRKI